MMRFRCAFVIVLTIAGGRSTEAGRPTQRLPIEAADIARDLTGRTVGFWTFAPEEPNG
jgi:hypothetical protein